MKLDVLLNVNPELFDAYMDLFEEYLEKYYEHSKRYTETCREDLCLKFAEPTDLIFGALRDEYQCVYRTQLETTVFNASDCGNRMPVAQEGIFIGWYCNVSFKGQLSVRLEGISRHKIAVRDVYENKNPPHYFFTTNVVHFRENYKVEFVIYNDEPFDIVGEIYPLVVLMGSKRQFCNGFIPLKIRISNPGGNYDHLLSELEKRLKPTPIEFVTIKNEDGDEQEEIRAKLDPEFEEWLKSLKGGEICQFCGSKITRIQKYCHFCGVPMLRLEEVLDETI